MFKFDLQAVLDFRVRSEEMCLVAYSGQSRRVEDAKKALEQLRERKLELMKQFQNGRGELIEKMGSVYIPIYSAYIRRMIEKEQEQRAVVSREEEILEEKRNELVSAVKNRKVLENLRDKKMQEYRAEAFEKERKQMDEFGIARFQDRVENEEGDHSL